VPEQSLSQSQAIERIIEHSRSGRRLVFLTGAGISIEAGIPALNRVTRYLGMMDGFISRGVFSPSAGRKTGPGTVGEEYRDDPSLYLQDFGWPDPYQLQADLWNWIDREKKDEDFRNDLDRLVRSSFVQNLRRFEPGFAKAVLGEKEADDWVKRRWPGSGSLEGNWKTLLAHLTKSNPDYVDTLFKRLVRGRAPGTAHRFLAFLTPILELRLFLTVNFDNLLEEALQGEGLHPTVYEVSRESALPHESLVRDELSVVKLHGGAFGLRAGESLDYPLDENSKRRLSEYLSEQSGEEDPILIVMGIGGADRRVLDFVSLVASQNEGLAADAANVYWLHFGACPESVTALRRESPDRLQPVQTYSPSSFLVELYQRHTQCHPPSVQAYQPQMRYPVLGSSEKVPDQDTSHRIWLFVDDEEDLSLGASVELARFVEANAHTHTPIWIDLETKYTYGDVVVEIIRQIRQYDPSVPPIGFPAAATAEAEEPNSWQERVLRAAVRRIYDALLRGRYILALNGLWDFGRPPTRHHRLKSEPPDAKSVELTARLLQSAGRLRASFLAVTLRREQLTVCKQILEDEALTHLVSVREVASACTPEPRKEDFQGDFDALLHLAAFRRRRSQVALWKLLGKPGETLKVDALLARHSAYVRRLEGGEYWMARGMRNKIYEIGQKQISWQELFASQENDPNEVALRNLASLIDIHGKIARYHVEDLYAASQDVFALLEYVYHQVAELRYLTKLHAWLLKVGPRASEIPAEAWSDACARLGFEQPLPRPEVPMRLGDLRARRLLAFYQVFRREHEVLRSRVSSDTLINWIDWICAYDLELFQLSSRGFRESQEIVGLCRDLADLLQDMKGDALREKIDYVSCIQHRVKQIAKLIDHHGKAHDVRWLLSRSTRSLLRKWVERGSAESLDTWQRRWFRLVDYTSDIWLSFQWLGDLRLMTKVAILSDALYRQIEQNGRSHDERSYVRILKNRHNADYRLMRVTPWAWELRFWRDKDDDRVHWETKEAALEVQRISDEGLEALALTGEDTLYARYKSYFHSLKGQSFYLLGDFSEAFRELDISRSGLDASVPADRESLAVSLLRLAEGLMVRADRIIEKEAGDSLALATQRAQRRLSRTEHLLDNAEATLVGARQDMQWWAWLYQLRAQLEVERLLLQPFALPGCQGDLDRHRFNARIARSLQGGLRAIRQGLDVVLSRPWKRGSSRFYNVYVDRFLQLWIELMTCGAYLRCMTLSGGVADQAGQDFLWIRWKALNEAAGLELLVADPVRGPVMSKGKWNMTYPAGLEARSFVQGWIRDAIDDGLAAVLKEALAGSRR
jgi:hypothetical protein